MPPGRALVLLVCVVALGGPGVIPEARADGPAPSLATQAAQAHYDAGHVYFTQGDARRALVEFLAAQRDDDRPALDFDIALCHERLADPARAVHHLRRFLERDPSANRVELEARIAGLERQTGELVLIGTAPDAALTIDDEPLVLGPNGATRVSAGPHRVRIAKEGHDGRDYDVRVVAGGRTELRVALGPSAVERKKKRRTLAIALGITGGAIVVGTAVVLGVVLGTQRAQDPYVGNVGVIVVNP